MLTFRHELWLQNELHQVVTHACLAKVKSSLSKYLICHCLHLVQLLLEESYAKGEVFLSQCYLTSLHSLLALAVPKSLSVPTCTVGSYFFFSIVLHLSSLFLFSFLYKLIVITIINTLSYIWVTSLCCQDFKQSDRYGWNHVWNDKRNTRTWVKRTVMDKTARRVRINWIQNTGQYDEERTWAIKCPAEESKIITQEFCLRIRRNERRYWGTRSQIVPTAKWCKMQVMRSWKHLSAITQEMWCGFSSWQPLTPTSGQSSWTHILLTDRYYTE